MPAAENLPRRRAATSAPLFLIVFLAACLCGLAGFFLIRESRVKEQLKDQRATMDQQAKALIGAEANMQAQQQQLEKLEAVRRQHATALSTNQAMASALRRDFESTRQQIDRVETQSRLYKEAIDQANATIRKQNDQIRFQNDEIRKFITERNEAVQRYNRLATNFNDLARKWNGQQEELMRAATNNAAR